MHRVVGFCGVVNVTVSKEGLIPVFEGILGDLYGCGCFDEVFDDELNVIRHEFGCDDLTDVEACNHIEDLCVEKLISDLVSTILTDKFVSYINQNMRYYPCVEVRSPQSGASSMFSLVNSYSNPIVPEYYLDKTRFVAGQKVFKCGDFVFGGNCYDANRVSFDIYYSMWLGEDMKIYYTIDHVHELLLGSERTDRMILHVLASNEDQVAWGLGTSLDDLEFLFRHILSYFPEKLVKKLHVG